MGQNYTGTWSIQNRTEIPWPLYTSRVRQRGQYVRVLQPGHGTGMPVRVLPAGSTNFDLLAAFGNRFPEEFNPNRVPQHRLEMAREQQAANPWDVEEQQFLEKPFIAGSTLHTIPSTRVNLGVELNLKRCCLCQW